MAAVSSAAADATGHPLRREALLWALNRAKGSERAAVALAVAQPRAAVAAAVLRDPLRLRSFAPGAVTTPMARKARETLRGEAVRPLLEALDSVDAAWRAKEGMEPVGEGAFGVGALVAVRKCSLHDCPLTYAEPGEHIYCDVECEG
eukprot:scaffold30230_cov67-Isochrysis_galbana.AAC.1